LHCAATDGLGIALLPTFIVGPDLQAGALQVVLPDYTPAELGIYAVYPPNRQLAAKVRAFIDLLARHFGPRPRWDLVE
jgi:DNA-binding transcriptional LysR family regulator